MVGSRILLVALDRGTFIDLYDLLVEHVRAHDIEIK
jgi:hypothetical protein